MTRFVVLVAALLPLACRTSSLPGDSSDLAAVDGFVRSDLAIGDYRALAAHCGAPDGPIVPLPDLANAKARLPGLWGVCSQSSATLGPWTPPSFAGIEFVADDSVTPAQAGGGRWYFLARGSDGTIARGQGFDAQGTFLYNPFPAGDSEQVHLMSGGSYADFTVAFERDPVKMRMLGPNSFSALFASF